MRNIRLRLFAALLLAGALLVASACGTDDINENGGYYTYDINDIDINYTYPNGYYAGHYIENDIEHYIYTPAPAPIVVYFEPADTMMRALGFGYTAYFNGNTYFFEYLDTPANTAFIHINEMFLREIYDFTDMGSPPFRFFYASTPAGSPITNRGLHFTHGINFRGWLVYLWSVGTVPMWLAAGIESVALSNIGVFTPDFFHIMPTHFGDLALSPGYWGTPAQTLTVNASYHFVRHLISTGVFNDIMYMLRQRDPGALPLLADLFYNFSGGSHICPIRYTLIGFRGAYNLVIVREKATYRFIFDHVSQYLGRDAIMLYTNYTDDGLLFVYDWFSRHYDFNFTRINRAELVYPHGHSRQIAGTLVEQVWSHAFNVNHMRAYAVGYRSPYCLVQRAVRVLELQAGFNAFAPFSRGLGQVLNDMFALQDQRLVTDTNPAGTAHIDAYRVLYHPDTIPDPYATKWLPLFSPVLAPCIASYATSRSFVWYLIETYGHEDFAAVHFNMRDFEDVYGVDIHEMIDRWRGFLRDFDFEGAW